MSLVSYPAALGHLKSGRVRLLGVGSTQRIDTFADVPTLAELIGQPGFEASVWYGFLMPSGTAPDRVAKLHAEIAKASGAKPVIDFMVRSSITPGLQSPQQFAASIRDDVTMANKMITAAKLRPE